MNLLNKNKLLKLLYSPDIENREIAKTYLLSNFDLDFKVKYGLNTSLNPSYEIYDGKTIGFVCNVKQLLDLIVNIKDSTVYLESLLDRIYEYNNK